MYINQTNQEGITILSIDVQGEKMNLLNAALRKELAEKIDALTTDENCKGVIITSSRDEFIVGADLKELLPIETAEEIYSETRALQNCYRYLETMGKPVVAAITGTALGGGFELCLASHHRIALNNPKAKVGLPEVQLGLLPGGGGTQRLPRLIGIEASLPFLMEGKKLPFKKAVEVGLIDEMADSKEEMIQKAKDWINQHPEAVQPWDEKGFRIPKGGLQNPKIAMLLMGASGMLMKKTRGNYPAPKAILSCIYEGGGLQIDAAFKIEARYFTGLVLSKESKNLIRTLFFHLNAANAGAARPKNIDRTTTEQVTVLGAGMMGAGIAYVSALSGCKVVLKDVDLSSAEKGKKYSENLLQKQVERGRMNQEKMQAVLNQITPVDSVEKATGSDLIIEAVFENSALKEKVIKETEEVTTEETVFASNTSTLPITGLASYSKRPENFIGLHFFSPVEKMPLVEIILGEKTSDETLAKAFDYVRLIKKTPIVVNDSRGFYTSRVFKTYLFEGMELLNEGVSPALIENAGLDAGMAIGPLAVTDEVSIELLYKVAMQTKKDTGMAGPEVPMQIIRDFVEKYDRIGKKAGKGFYTYPTEAGGKKQLWKELNVHYPAAKEQPKAKMVQKRLLYIQSLEAVRCLEENVLRSPVDGDIGSIMGWGFPAFTGGVFSLIDTMGVDVFIQECEQLEKQLGDRFAVPDLLKEMASEGKTFHATELRKPQMA